MAEEKYVLKHEYEADKGKIYKKINAEKADTNMKINAQDKLLHVFIESQKPIAKGFQNMEEQLITLNSNMSDFKDSVSDHGRRIKSIEDTTTARSKHNTTIIATVITGLVTLAVAALGFAQVFF